MTPPSARLSGNLGLVSVVLFGLAYMAPAVVVSIFGVIAATSGGAAPTAYVVATAAMLLTGLSYAKMSRIHANSGSIYTYARRQLSSHIGFLAGWAMLLDYLFLPMVAWPINAVYLHAQYPSVPQWLWLVINIVAATVVNVLGIKLADRVNRVLLIAVAVALIGLTVLCVRYGLDHGGAAAAGHAVWNNATSISSVTAGAAIAAYAFLGFDAVSTLSEETRRPERTIPRGIVLTVLAGGATFVLLSFVMQWVHPRGAFPDESSAGYLVATVVGGKGFADVFNTISMLGGLASAVAIQASSSRLMFVMGRDGALPRQVFGRLHPTLRTPVANIVLIGCFGLLAMNLALDQATSLINFGAFLGFTLVNICVIAYAVRRRRAGERRSVFGYLVIPTAGAIVTVYLITQLGSTAVELGLGWLALGVCYLVVLTKGFRTPPPELHTDSEDPEPEAAAASPT